MIITFDMPTKLIVGAGSFSLLGEEARKRGARALLVSGQSSARRMGFLERAVADLKKHGVAVTVFEGVEPNPRSSTIDAGAKLIRNEKLDLVIALGGGSPMDAAKGMVVAATGNSPVWHYVQGGVRAAGKSPVLITVPTVAASGSEANCGAVITNWETREKCVLSDRCAYPAVSLVDPELTLSLPTKPTAQGGVDIFCHLLEPYVTAAAPQSLTDGIAETTMKLVVDFLPQVLERPDDLEARSQLSWASTIACSAFASLGGGDGSMTMHGLEHPLSGYYDIAHGDGLAALLPAYLESLADIRAARLAKLGSNVFGQADGLMATDAWLREIGMDLKLRNLQVAREKLSELAQCALRTAPWLSGHPSKLGREAISRIYEAAW
ncbi:MAG: iron-containing alcohol dehydrogenase [Dehalococcoidia bacterium]|nr:iron-containing alcohol dehydrogenase [Dehalococcoidia bacterium]